MHFKIYKFCCKVELENSTCIHHFIRSIYTSGIYMVGRLYKKRLWNLTFCFNSLLISAMNYSDDNIFWFTWNIVNLVWWRQKGFFFCIYHLNEIFTLYKWNRFLTIILLDTLAQILSIYCIYCFSWLWIHIFVEGVGLYFSAKYKQTPFFLLFGAWP